MNRNLSFVLVVAAAACGLALAQVPQRSDAAQLAALSKRVEVLETELSELKKIKPGAGAEFESALAKDRLALEQVVKYLQAQSGAAEKLQGVLTESEQKGFTFGINPDSRIVLLSGFQSFAETMRTDVPGAAAPAVEPVNR